MSPIEVNAGLAAAGGSAEILFFPIILVAGAAIIALQVLLAQKGGKWAGLVLPIISFGISLLAVLAVLLLSVNTATMTTTINGEIVEQTTQQIAGVSSIIGSAIIIFVLCNIPTAILLAIYVACSGKRNRQRSLERMSAQDLE
jgi:hypothetical protein